MVDPFGFDDLIPKKKSQKVEVLPSIPELDDPEASAEVFVSGIAVGSSLKKRYLSFRLCGLGKRESAQLCNVQTATVNNWIHADPELAKIENDLPNKIKEFSDGILDLQFRRNFRLVLEKDYQVLNKAVNSEYTDIPLSSADQRYLEKIRSNYTPQQLQQLKQLLTGEVVDPSQNFTQFIINIAKNGDINQVQVQGAQNGQGVQKV